MNRNILIVPFLLALPILAPAQPPVDSSKSTSDIVELSPFAVVGTEDRGYQAQSSLAGTRLKTNLKDIGTPISAFTQQFLRDTAITDTSQLAKYEISTEYDFAEDAAANMNSIKGDSAPIRVRGIVLTNGTASPSVNFFKIDGRLDVFSIERLDQARGPNSILFGIGTAAGTLNVTTKRARLNASGGEVAVTGRRFDGFREEVDYNQVALTDRAAIRVAAVRDNQGSWRDWEYNDNERYFGTATLKLTKSTEVRVEGEHGHVDKATKRTFTAYDAYTPWRDAGKPISATAVPGVQILSTAAYIVYDTATGTVMNWKGKTTSQKATSSDGTALVLRDFSILPKETSIVGDGFKQLKDYTRTTAFLNQEITPHLNLELSAFRNDNLTHDYDPQLATGLALQADTNPTLPNGAINPNAGRTYLEGLPQLSQVDTRDDALRGIIAYDHDFGHIFGQHSLAGVFQYNHQNYQQYVTREQILTNPLSTATPENNANRVFRRTYVDLNGPSKNIVMADYRLRPTIDGFKEQVSGTTLGSAWIPFNSNTQINSNKQTSFIGALQSAFWESRLHTVVGVSRDFRTDYYSTQSRTTLAPFTTGILYPVVGNIPFTETANSVSVSGVFRIFDFLSATYSHAANSGIPNPIGTLHTATGHPPQPKGKSEDVGLKLDLFNDKLFITASHYTSGDKDDFDFTGVLAATINPIWNALDTAGVLKANGLTIDQVLDKTNGSTRDTSSKGWEVEMTANPSPNFRIYANYTNNTTKVSNIGREQQAYINANLPFWTANAAVPIADSTTVAKTVGDQITIINNAVFNQFIVADNREPLGQSRHKANLLFGYDFTSGWLKNFSIGGGSRYISANLIAFTVTGTVGNLIRTPVYATNQFFADGNISYSRKLTPFHHPVLWSVQLNINNIFDNHAFVRLRQNDSGQLLNYKFNDPLQWIISSRFGF